MQEEATQQKSGVSRMLFINSGLWMLLFLYSMKGTIILAWIVNFLCMVGIIAITSIGIAVIDVMLLKRNVSKVVKYVLFACPSIIVLIAMLSIYPNLQLPGKTVQMQKSPSGKYDLALPMENSHRQLTITNRKGAVEFQDEKINVNEGSQLYWVWDSMDNAWVYDTANQNVYVFTKKADKWEKSLWGVGTSRIGGDPALVPPKKLFPVKERDKASGTATIVKPAAADTIEATPVTPAKTQPAAN